VYRYKNNTRLNYFAAVIVVIIAGLLSRKISVVPQWIGDLLWALMIYLIISAASPNTHLLKRALLSLSFCFLIEFSQLYQANWINRIRQTLPGRLILGQGFLYSDLLAYTGGVFTGAITEWFRKR
jgi:hypothetical protein